jgi:glycine amidinotransferase
MGLSYRGVSERVVNSYNEWDPLEEVIVGTLEGAAVPTWQDSMRATMPTQSWDFFRRRGGGAYRSSELSLAIRELDEFARILGAEGVVVKRPDPLNQQQSFSTPDWSCTGGLYAAMPRDLLLVVGDELIEAPMSWRTRYFEVHAFRSLLKDYFRKGARWTSAPRARLPDELFNSSYQLESTSDYAITEYEPTFDAADFSRLGRDIIVQKSHVTNDFGIDWLGRHLGPDFRIHRIAVNDPHSMHIDATFVPLCPGKVLVNPDRLPSLPPFLRGWDVLRATQPTLPQDWPLYMSSPWVSMNVLMLDPKRVVVERQEEPLIRALTEWGFECIRVDFRHVMTFGGSFHCVTADIRRRGELQSYF